MSTIKKGDLVLVTGIGGYIGSHVADQLLDAGYTVRGTSRSRDSTSWLFELFDNKYGKGKFDVVEIKDMTEDGAFDEAVKGVAGICHLASVLSFSTKPDEVIPPTVKGALNILTSATKEPSVKSVVYTSSSTAALIPVPNQKVVVTKDTWNDSAVQQAATDPDVGGYVVYSASKTEAERAFWKAVNETNPPFQTVAILPNANFGPILKPGGEMSASTGSWPVAVFNGDTTPFVTPPQYYIDVRDDARLHVAALIDPACNRQRIFGFAGAYNWNDVLAILRKQNPGKTFPEDGEFGRDLSEVPSAEAEELLRKHYGKGWTSLEESIAGSTATLRG